MWSLISRGIVVLIVLLAAVSAMHGGSYELKPTAPMPAVNVP
jgi:hypothetical protein